LIELCATMKKNLNNLIEQIIKI